MHQELLFADILKFTKKVRKTFALTKTPVMETCSVSCIFQAIIVIVVIKILEKNLLRSSVLEMNA